MLVGARSRKPWFAKSSFVQGSNWLATTRSKLPWIPDPDNAFSEVARTLKKGGVFAFATLGPVSPAFNVLPDMHDIGDGLVRAGFADPVLDIDRLTVDYEDASKLQDDMTRLGPFAAPENATSTAGLSLELELVYGHCWGNGPRPDPGNIGIDANRIPLRR